MKTKAMFGFLAVLTALLPGVVSATNDVTFGSQWWSLTAPEAKFQEYREVPRGGFLESFYLREHKNQDMLAFWGTSALQGDQHNNLWLAHGVRWQLDGSYTAIPHRFSNLTKTPYGTPSPGVFLLPDSLQRLIQSIPFPSGATYNARIIPILTDQLNSSAAFPTAVRTAESKMRLQGRPAKGFKLEVTGLERQREGNMPFGAAFGTSNAIELPLPISQRTLDGQVAASYLHNDFTMNASVGGSVFKNNISTLIWDNPRRLVDTLTISSRGRIDLPPDNHVVRGQVAVGWRLPRQSLFTATLGMSQGKQDDAFLPYTINTAATARNSLDSLPARSLAGKLTRLTQDYRLTGRLLPNLSGTARFNSSRDDNKTPSYFMTGFTGTDGRWSATPRETDPYGHTHNVLGLDLNADIHGPLSAGVTYELRTRDRTFREVEKDKENVIGGRADLRLGDAASLHSSYKFGDRKQDAFSTAEYFEGATQVEQSGMRRFDVANRKHSETATSLSWMVNDKIDLDLQHTYVRNKYEGVRYGLRNAQENGGIAEATIHASSNVDMTGGFGFALASTEQEGHQGRPSDVNADSSDWNANLKDKNSYVFTGVEWSASKQVLVNADYVFTRVMSDYRLSGLFGRNVVAAQDLPSTLYRHHDFRLQARYRIGNTDLAARYYFEQFDVVDFSAENVPQLGVTAGATTYIYLGDNLRDYIGHRVALVASRRF
jgi:MtrB/PioB family decaheme-associated outer membrane protein